VDIRAFNRRAWERQVEMGNRWTVPVSPEAVADARRGKWHILLTPSRPVPPDWFPPLVGCDVLCLASGGGQQGPILAAAGANVTVFDNSPRQLDQDRMVAEREGLAITTIEGDMADLSELRNEAFDLIVHPVSNTFVPTVHPVWREAYRVLKPGGTLLAGFTNPALYLFDWELGERTGVWQVRYALPYSDVDVLSEEEKAAREAEGSPYEFSHTLDDQIGGQLVAGFVLVGFYEDRHENLDEEPLDRYLNTFMATRALKPTPVAGAEASGT